MFTISATFIIRKTSREYIFTNHFKSPQAKNSEELRGQEAAEVETFCSYKTPYSLQGTRCLPLSL